MNDQNHDNLPVELEELDARLSALGATERAQAPADLEARIMAATSGVIAPAAAPRKEPIGVIGRLSIKRLDWPMRAAAVIAVMIGGWAVFHGADGPQRGPGPEHAVAIDPEKLANFVFNSGPSEQLQRLLLETATLETLTGNDDLTSPDGDQESL